MCFSVQVDVDLKKLAKEYQARISSKFEENIFKKTATGYSKTDQLPVLFSHEGTIRIEPMNWSLVPKWSKEYPAKWSTYNAKMERIHKGINQKIYEVPSFKDPFKQNKFCLIPIVSAIEACYWGKTKGQIISFGNKEKSTFMAAGLYESWVKQETGEIKNTCTLLTDSPYQYLFDHGHDRSIILMNKEKHLEFIKDKQRKIENSFQFIKKNRVDQDWSYESIREVTQASIKKNTPTESELQEIKETVWTSI